MITTVTPTKVRHQGLSFPLKVEMTDRIDLEEFNRLKPGTVVLVRSKGTLQIGDHFALIVGPLVQKTVGLRPRVLVFKATSFQKWILDLYEPESPILLKLSDQASASFREWHNIELTENGDVILHA